MERIPVAFVGIDHPHAKDWHQTLAQMAEFEPVAHYDPDAQAGKALLSPPYDRLPVYGDLTELLAHHEVKAAIVMLPLRSAEQAMVTLARAGVHMMAEKPVARTAAGLQPVAEIVGSELVFYAGYAWRWDPIVRQIRTLVEQGILGELLSIEMRWITSRVGRREGTPFHRDPRSYLFRREISGGGILGWLGCHFLDVMLYVSQQAITRVAAMTARQTTGEIDVEDTATCLLEFGNGMLGTLHVGYLLPSGGQMFLGLRGSLGWVHWDMQDGRRFTVHSEHPIWTPGSTRVFDFPRPAIATYGGGTGEALLRDFARCISERGASPLFTIEDGMRVLRVLDAAYAAADSGRSVVLSR